MPARPIPSLDDLAALLAKYAEIERLRVAHLGASEPDPRRAMAALAARFPGALREIDDLPLEEIRSRLGALERARDLVVRGDDARALPQWMVAMSLFHALARGALAAKRWLAGRKHVDDDVRAAFARAAARMRITTDAAAWAPELAEVATPPRGRLMDLVFARLAARLAIDDAEARRLIFGEPRSARRDRAPSGVHVLEPELEPDPPLGAAAGVAAGAAVSVLAGADSFGDDEPVELDPPLSPPLLAGLVEE